jgi:hypothetical protein
MKKRKRKSTSWSQEHLFILEQEIKNASSYKNESQFIRSMQKLLPLSYATIYNKMKADYPLVFSQNKPKKQKKSWIISIVSVLKQWLKVS